MTTASPTSDWDKTTIIATLLAVPLDLWSAWLALLGSPAIPYALGPWLVLCVGMPSLLRWGVYKGRLSNRTAVFTQLAGVVSCLAMLYALRGWQQGT